MKRKCPDGQENQQDYRRCDETPANTDKPGTSEKHDSVSLETKTWVVGPQVCRGAAIAILAIFLDNNGLSQPLRIK
jgi:hypothetical protein